MTEIHQFVQSLVAHDAISTHARHLQSIIREMGYHSEIYAGEQQAGRNDAKYFREFVQTTDNDNTWLLYHLSTLSPVADFLKDRPQRIAVNYHNITPAEYFAPWEPLIGAEVEAARRQFAEFSKSSEVAIGVSHYNEAELQEANYKNTMVAPVLFDPADFQRDLDSRLNGKLQRAKERGGSDWLFVGRVAPHKCQHDIIQAFAAYRQLFDSKARLHIVGGVSSHRYWTSLRRYVEALQLDDFVNITGGVSNGALGAYYRNADVFVCLSEHEGFGVPLLEAMHNDLPVVAFDAAAVGETVGDAALLLPEKTPATVAVAVHKLLNDEQLANSLVKSGNARLSDFELSKSTARWREVLAKMINTSRS